MRKAFSTKVIGTALALVMLASPLTASAHTGSINQLQSKKTQIDQETQQLQNKIAANKAKIHTLTGEITSTQIQIGQTGDQMKTLNQQIQTTEDRIKKRTNLLKLQVKATYMNGTGQNLINLLLNANNFGDLVNRAYAVFKITNQQQNLINQQRRDETQLKQEQLLLQQKAKDTTKSLTDLKQYVNDLQSTMQKQQKELANLNSQKASLTSQIRNLSVLSLSGNSPSVTIPSLAVSGSVSELIQKSEKWIGHSSYVFGGGRTSYDRSHGYFDCSGFVHWAYEQIGVNLSGWTTTSLRYVGEAVSPSDMKPGDLVFFNTYEPNGHVGIYIGNGEFIGSQSSKGVSIENIHSSYWASHFSGVVRRVLT